MSDRPSRPDRPGEATQPALRIALMLESDGPGGAERLLLNLAEELRHRGHDVCPVGPSAGTGWLSGQFRARGFEPETFQLRRPLDWRCAARLYRTLTRRQIDVVHSHEFTMAVYGTLVAGAMGRPHVITFHGSQTMTRALRRRIALRWAIRRSRSVAVSEATRSSLVADLGGPASRIGVIRNGVPVRQGDGERARLQLGIAPDEPMVLAIGNLDPRKGHSLLLQALMDQPSSGPRWRLVIAGGRGGTEGPRLAAMAEAGGVSNRLSILEFRDDIPDLLAAADLFVMPSLWEGLPLALLEAMLAGKPIIASATSGIPEAIRHGREGILVAPGELAPLTAALERLLTGTDLRQRLGQAARDRAMGEFTVGAMTDGYEQLYRDSGRR